MEKSPQGMIITNAKFTDQLISYEKHVKPFSKDHIIPYILTANEYIQISQVYTIRDA